ncbi:ATP-binding protein [bacterium]|nr:ATP-binding protein [bacterium]
MISKTIEESKKRIINSFESLNLNFPLKHISINLAPAEISKEGTHYDLAIAVGLLKFVANFSYDESEDCFLGELSFNGDLRKLNNAFYLCIIAKQLGFTKVYIPYENLDDVVNIRDIEIIGVKSLGDLLINSVFTKKLADARAINKTISKNFTQIIGNKIGKRALSLAISGHHHLLLEGFPGAGKSLLAKSASELLPNLNESQAVEKSTLYSYLGISLKPESFYSAPFRSPHNSSSYSAIFGSSGKNIIPGEVALANNGILFLDEFPEFNRLVIEGLRSPLEDKKVEISRAKIKRSFPTDFILIATMNPCRCGYFNHKKIMCKCSPYDIRRYQSRISGPILDRIDIHLKIDSNIEVKSNIEENNYSIEEYFKVLNTIKETREELKSVKNKYLNGPDNPSKESNNFALMLLDEKSYTLMSIVQEKYSLSNRKLFKVLNLALTISLFEKKEKITSENFIEALSLSGITEKTKS